MSKRLLIIALLCYSYLSFAQDTTSVAVPEVIQLMDSFAINTEIPMQIEMPSIQEETIVPAIDNNPSKKKKKKVNIEKVRILFGINYSFYSPLINEKDNYSGIFYPEEDAAPSWVDRNTKNNLARSYKTGHFQFSIQANVWKGLFTGMNYQFTTIKNYKKDPMKGNMFSKKNTMLFLVSAQIGYLFEFLKNKALQIHPSIRIGGYTADDYYDSGKGRKFYFGTDLQIRYLIKRKAGFSLGVDYDYIRYKKEDYSTVFHKDIKQYTTFSNVHLNAGIFVNVSILTKK